MPLLKFQPSYMCGRKQTYIRNILFCFGKAGVV